MFNTLRNKKGISLVEAMIAICVTSVAIVALGAMQPLALHTSAGSDYRGRAVAIAQAQAADLEAVIMSPGAVIPANLTNSPLTVQNITYRVTTSTVFTAPNFWLVTVQVTWPGTTKGVTHNRIVTQQQGWQ
ncbi:MAG: hypothetical protein ABSC54_07095 [Smithellaceae bacterium]|jgi:Tfp pilus assembly protein PilV